MADLPELLPEADWLIMLAPLTPETRGLIGAPELALLPRGARFVNIGRGPVLVEAALIEALRSGALAGAALDVFEREPLAAGQPAVGHAQRHRLTAHRWRRARDAGRLRRAFLANLRRYLAGEPLENVVDKHLGYVTADR